MKKENQNLKVELSDEGKELLKFIEDVQNGKLSDFKPVAVYETTLPMFDLQPTPLYHIWGKVI